MSYFFNSRSTMYEAYYLFLGYISSQLPWTLIFLITQYFGIRLYCLSDRDICIRVQKRINGWCTHKADNDKGYGYSLGYIYFVSITCNPDGDYNCWIVATSDSYNYLTKGKDEVVNLLSLDCLPKEDLKIYERSGSYNNCWFKKRTVKINSIQPRPDQDTILKKIMEHQSKYNHTVVYLHGAPGTGKSIIGVLLANMYKSAYCNTLKLWQPGDTLGSLYSDVEPTADSPLVLVFDEFDGPLTQIHVGVEPHKNLTIQTPDKAGWNQLLDEIHIGMYPYLIIVLTSNKSPEYICEMDPSYIRKGRVDLIFEVGKIDSSLAKK